MATAIHGSPPSADKSTARWLNFHNFLLALCIATLSYRLYTVIIGGGWEDRSQFFGDGEIRPNLIDFIYNEIFVNYLILRVIAFKYNPIVLLLVVLSAFAYFTRLPITLLFFAIIFSRSISFRTKLLLASISLALSFLVLYLRFGEDLLYADTSSVFYLTYPLVGVGRLWGTTQEYGTTALQYLSLFLKPLDAVLFVLDYIGQRAGELSTGRHVGLELSRFVYIQSLEGAYNAFGTILYPFILIAGWIVGPILFIFFIVFQYLQYRFVTQDRQLSLRYIYLLMSTGVLFSWTSPFVWLVPFMFAKIRNR
ncbi:hypothetical protein [Sphingomonas sp.]|uniref:hypothetical protein n=1 Tax=Sphingomonas sp. TaxID=28214 RepID=UPI0035C7BEEE